MNGSENVHNDDNSMENYEKLVFETEEGTEEFFVIEQTMLGGINYILVTDDVESDEADFMILKETVVSGDEEYASYEIIEDDNELKSVIAIFGELIDDFDLEV